MTNGSLEERIERMEKWSAEHAVLDLRQLMMLIGENDKLQKQINELKQEVTTLKRQRSAPVMN